MRLLLRERLHLFDGVQDPALGASLDEAGQRHHQLDREVVVHERFGVMIRPLLSKDVCQVVVGLREVRPQSNCTPVLKQPV